MKLGTLLAFPSAVAAALMMGTGIYDSTGPINDLVMMGMANPKQVGAGLHQRLRSRAFVAHDTTSDKRIAFVSLDSGMGGLVLNNRVLAELEKRFPGLYSSANVGISGTHTHSGPSGFLQDVIFQFAGSGWQPHTLDAMVNGVVESIAMAHKNLVPARASLAVGELEKSNINRSPTSYLRNPAEERALYDGDTDLNMTLLRIDSLDGKELGMINWFAVHPTSMNNTNLLVSGDNKGYASYLFEQYKNGPTSQVWPGHGDFVAAFASTNLGDVSPNTKGPHCRDTGLPCDNLHSTCNNRTEQCSAFGPGKDMFESCQIIGSNQYKKAVELFDQAKTADPIGDSVDSVQTFIKMPGLNVSDPTTGKPLGHLCYAAMGDSFAAGTTDGPGMFDFTQGANSSNPFWHFIAGFLHKVTPEEKACHEPKGILLPTGHVSIPHPWAPDTLPLQIQRIGKLAILHVPTEFTTMAGRRMRKHIKARMVAKGVLPEDGTVVLAGLSNSYADYTTTFEEYQAQRYEAASTAFGPHQLNAFIQEMSKLVDWMAVGKPAPAGPTPDDFSGKLGKGKQPSTDYLPSGASKFGQTMVDVAKTYKVGGVASATFAGANSLNNLRPQGTFAEIQKCADAACSSSTVVAVDSDWETRLHINKSHKDLVLATRSWTIEWYIPPTAAPGSYRIVHYGTSYNDPLVGKAKFTDYTGTSSVFTVTA
mmetsp:Transcript_35382/g.69396  ORF Transcript_35382/g.69396 Transcript_35382/m.69396 type:complete len:704 (+) Transcript_35382:36-2147(+)|eukprot:CAMPEP_0175136930 /NCGR_PEP_ID=MMETSP0087-20121206/9541_1 /TAXON_ID=136419 /ORGANISM="Unknown Unknown, Strain D1" /LENGTH=703 /DNA_ID=CAMNT_0016419725 /DNA_START=36 /DNA_END=2147 /DNA_ORIENTATION=-